MTVPQPIQWSTIQAALQTWAADVSIPALNVVLSDDGGRVKQYPFATIKFVGLSPVGMGHRVTSCDGTGLPGQEIEVDHFQWYDATVAVEVFCDNPTGQDSAPAILGRMLSRLRLDSVRNALIAAGIAPFDIVTDENLTGLTSADWQARAVGFLRAYVIDAVTEYEGYFDTAHVLFKQSDADPGVTVSLTLEAN